MTKNFQVAMTCLVLAACGGGGGGTPPAETVRDLTGSSPPLESAAAQSARVAGILSRSDSVILSTFYGETTLPEVPQIRIRAECSGTRCILREPQFGFRYIIDLDDLSITTGTQTLAHSKYGITLFVSEADTGETFGSWMQHSAFGVSDLHVTTDGITVYGRGGEAGGDLTGFAPNFSATWRGVVVGTPTTGGSKGDFLQGDAFLSYGFNASDLAEIDVSFTNIKNIDKNRSHSVASIRFDDVPVYTDGTFEAGLTGNRIQGGFYGPSYAETAGVFEQQNVVGAFGAKK